MCINPNISSITQIEIGYGYKYPNNEEKAIQYRKFNNIYSNKQSGFKTSKKVGSAFKL